MNKRAWALHSTLLAIAGVAAQALGEPRVSGAPACEPVGPFTPICGLQAPEDLELLPNGRQVLVSQGRGPTHLKDSNLALLDLSSAQLRVLAASSAPASGWGDAGCSGQDPELTAHGIHLSRRKDRAWQLLVVNHGSRESVEHFELVHGNGAIEPGRYELKWRGCVHSPAGVMFNDVAALPDGGFVATIMGESRHFAGNDGLDFLLSGADTGHVVEWSPADGFKPLAGTERPFPNGVQTSPDGRYVYFAAWTGRKVVRYDRGNASTLEVPLEFYPDNLSWTAEGTLLTAGIDDTQSLRECLAAHSSFCGGAFRVAEIEPATMSAVTLIRGPERVIGGASAALRVGDALYVGAFSGDRIVRVAMPKVRREAQR